MTSKGCLDVYGGSPVRARVIELHILRTVVAFGPSSKDGLPFVGTSATLRPRFLAHIRAVSCFAMLFKISLFEILGKQRNNLAWE
jgi:hypothetical protein